MNYANRKRLGILSMLAAFICAGAIGLEARLLEPVIHQMSAQDQLIAAGGIIGWGVAAFAFLVIGIKLIDQEDEPRCVGCGGKPNGELAGWCKPCTGEPHA